MIDGTTCEVTEGKWSLTADLSEKIGGNGLGPDSGVLGRAAFGSCAAASYVLWVDGTAYSIVWPTNIQWPGGTAPTTTTDVLLGIYYNGTTTYATFSEGMAT